MNYALDELIDIPKLQALLDTLDEIHSLPSAIIDTAGKIHTATAWQDICTKFHRANPVSEKKCKESDSYIASQLDKEVAQTVYRCPFGLVDTATPVIVEGQHLCNVFTGQLFTEKPDEEKFVRQAREYGFDEKDYLEALRKVPVISEDRLRKNLKFLGELAGMLATQGLIQKRQLETEMALRESEEKHRILLDESSDPIFAFYPNGEYRYANYAFANGVGRKREEIIGKSIWEVFPKEEADKRFAVVKWVFESGESKVIEVRVPRPEGDRYYVTTAKPILDNQRRAISVVCVSKDITDRKQTERALEESRDQFKVVVENSPLAMALVCGNSTIEYINRKAIETFGYARQDIPSMDRWWAQAYPDETYRAEVIALWMGLVGQALAHNREIEQREYRVTCKNGSVKTVVIFGVWVADKVLVIFEDITERKQSEAQHAQLESQLRESQKMEALGTLAGGVAHDFNNTLAAILGNVELARQDVGSAHPALVSLEEIGKASRRAKDLVQQILAFSRRQKLKRRPMSLALVVVETSRLVRASLPAMVSLNVDCKGDAPAVLADATQIEQILLNLCANAAHAVADIAQPGVIEVNLSAYERTEDAAHDDLHLGRYACLTVRDNGRGMDEATRSRIFEPFFTTKPAGTGTGLGLSVVHGIVQAHEASIEVESNPGGGSTFRIYFPSVKAPIADVTAPPLDVTPVQGKGKHLLYLDDEAAIIFLMKRLLERKGYRVSGYTEPRQALAAVRANPSEFDLVVTDYYMPGMSGLEVAQALKELRPDLPVVMASGYISEELRTKAPAVGIRELIYKPNTVEDLCEAIAHFAVAQSRIGS